MSDLGQVLRSEVEFDNLETLTGPTSITPALGQTVAEAEPAGVCEVSVGPKIIDVDVGQRIDVRMGPLGLPTSSLQAVAYA